MIPTTAPPDSGSVAPDHRLIHPRAADAPARPGDARRRLLGRSRPRAPRSRSPLRVRRAVLAADPRPVDHVAAPAIRPWVRGVPGRLPDRPGRHVTRARPRRGHRPQLDDHAVGRTRLPVRHVPTPRPRPSLGPHPPAAAHPTSTQPPAARAPRTRTTAESPRSSASGVDLRVTSLPPRRRPMPGGVGRVAGREEVTRRSTRWRCSSATRRSSACWSASGRRLS